ncbi:uncharacterized protein LOC136064012 [Quercus suber]|uniref:uncharacterized protein LOC136063993 n=1 Tax=Quercus suber TaxID=58331 RepID=UPI0032DE87A9
MEHGHFLVIPPHFDENNYAYWKVRMKAILKSIDERVWNSVEYGWEKLTTPEFKRISNIEFVHTAWNILQTVHECTEAVKINKLQRLITRFESIRMSDDESFDEFYTKLNDIVNSAYNLGEIYDQPKNVRKILRSLIENFKPKVTAIIESKDMDSILVDELVGSLKSYELNLPKTNKSKSMALKSVDDVDNNGFDDKLSFTEIAYLVKNFRNFFRNNNRKARGYGHVKSECSTFLRSNGKVMTVILNNDKVFDHESGSDDDENFITFTATAVVDESVVVDENSFDGELSECVDLQEAYNKFCKVAAKNAMNVDLGLKKINSLELDKKNLLLKLFDANELIDKVKTENLLLLDKVKNLELELSVAREQTNKSASSKLEHMLSIQKSCGFVIFVERLDIFVQIVSSCKLQSEQIS